jgi:hypothetical protein
VGRDAGLTRMPPTPGRSPIGVTAPASPRTRRSTADPGQDPRDLTATPKTARRIKSGATACARPTCGPDPRTSAWRSADPRRSDAVLAYLGPATSHRAPRIRPTMRTPGATYRRLPLDGAVPYQKVKRVGHGFRNFVNYRLRLLLHCGVTWQTHRTARLRGRSPRLVA